MEEKFRKAMVQNAQSDNEKASLMYQVELFKDKIEDMDEAYALLQVILLLLFTYLYVIITTVNNILIVMCRKNTKTSIANVKIRRGK